MSSPSPSSSLIVAGRRVFLRRGPKSQTVNVCTDAGVEGTYELKWRLPLDVDIEAAGLSSLADLDALEKWALSHRGQPEEPGTRRPLRVDRVGAPPADDAWTTAAAAAVDMAITALVTGFLEDPYLHRVEHSLHTLLHSLLKEQSTLRDVVVPIGSSGHRTQLVHKEWPETVPGTEGKSTGPRGLFDIAVLAPSQLAGASLKQFRGGHLDAPIAVEVGLDYGFDHLKQDHDKLLHSRVPVPYLLHLSRVAVTDRDRTEHLLRTAPVPLRTAYVHLDPRTGERRVKHLAETDVSSV